MIEDTLAALFERHGVRVERSGGGLAFPEHGHRISASIVREREGADACAVQLDVRLEIAPGGLPDRSGALGGAGTLVESFVGIGRTRPDATGDALGYFMDASLHPILAAFFSPAPPADARVAGERWRIGGRDRRVLAGRVAWRGDLPDPDATAGSWSRRFREELEAVDLGPGTHWIRVFYAQTDGVPSALEVLLDNEPWPEARDALAGIDGPTGDGFFSLRRFLIVREP